MLHVQYKYPTNATVSREHPYLHNHLKSFPQCYV